MIDRDREREREGEKKKERERERERYDFFCVTIKHHCTASKESLIVHFYISLSQLC